MVSTEISVQTHQEQSAPNGRFQYHLLSATAAEPRRRLRPGNAHRADGWEELLSPGVERCYKQGQRVLFRADAAFANPGLYEGLEGWERELRYPVEARLWLRLIAYNLGNLWRLVLGVRNWSVTSVPQRLGKTGGRVIKHAEHYSLLLAKDHFTRRLFGPTVCHIRALCAPAG